MKHRTYLVVVIAITVFFLVASVAFAFTWSNVGGDPLVQGGVHTKAEFVKAMNDPFVQSRFEQVRAGNHLPKWILPQAFKLAKSKSNVRLGQIKYGEWVGTMGSGHSVDIDVTYKGQYRPLSTFYVQPSKSTTVKIKGKYYRKTVSYEVTLAQPCGNALIIHKHVTYKRLYELRVEKHLDSLQGERLAGWQIVIEVAGKVKNLTTKSTGSVLVGRYLAGTKYHALEILQDGWEIVSPVVGTFQGKMPRKNLTLKFVNKRTNEELFKLYVEKRKDTFDGPWLDGWEIKGTVGDETVDVFTLADGPVLVGEYHDGTGFNLSEVQQDGWYVISPTNGVFEGQIEGEDVLLTWVNGQPSYAAFATKGYWHNKNGLAEETDEDISYINTLAPYSANPFDGLDSSGKPVPPANGTMGEELAPAGTWRAEVSEYLVAPNAGGDPKIQLGQQLLAFIFNVRHRLGGTEVSIQLPDGSWDNAGSIINQAITAWQTGTDANYWSGLLDAYNNMEGDGPGTGVPYLP